MGRLRRFRTDVRIMVGTLATIVRFRRQLAPYFTYPFRCGGCGLPLRRVPGRWRDDIKLFAAPDGSYSCDGTIVNPHHPNAAPRKV